MSQDNDGSGNYSNIKGYLAHCGAKGISKLKVRHIKSHILHFQEFSGSLADYILYLRMKGYTDETIKSKYTDLKSYLRWVNESCNLSAM